MQRHSVAGETLARVVELETRDGVISIELYEKQEPEICASFVALAESEQLCGAVFPSLIPGFALVGQCLGLYGVPLGVVATEKAAHGGERELKHVGAGLVSCRVVPGSVLGSSFLVTLAPQPKLDESHRVFGRLYSGMRFLESIATMHVDEQFALFSPICVQRTRVVLLPRSARPWPRGQEPKKVDEQAGLSRLRHSSLVDSL